MATGECQGKVGRITSAGWQVTLWSHMIKLTSDLSSALEVCIDDDTLHKSTFTLLYLLFYYPTWLVLTEWRHRNKYRQWDCGSGWRWSGIPPWRSRSAPGTHVCPARTQRVPGPVAVRSRTAGKPHPPPSPAECTQLTRRRSESANVHQVNFLRLLYRVGREMVPH